MSDARMSDDAVEPTLRELVREAYEHHGGSVLAAGFQAVAVHRFLNWTKQRPQPLRLPLRLLGRIAYLRVRNVYGIELPASVTLGRRFEVVHQGGIVIHANAVFGDDCVIRQGVTVGAAGRGPYERDHPTIGNRVHFGAGSVAMGRISIGDDVTIGPNAVVMASVPAGSYVVAAASRTVQRRATAAPHSPSATSTPGSTDATQEPGSTRATREHGSPSATPHAPPSASGRPARGERSLR